MPAQTFHTNHSTPTTPLLLYQSGTCTTDCPNNSAAQGYYWYTALNAHSDVNFEVTGTQSCNNAEGVSDGKDPDFGVKEEITIANDMTTLCTTP